MIPAFINKSRVPHKSGIYKFKDSNSKIIYIGKAIDLASRVGSYFSSSNKDPKTINLVSQIRSVETIIVESELEALILEANLIKKYKPIFNIRLTDDKYYLYIAVTKEDFPKIITARKKDLKSVKKYFGPFPSAKTVMDTLKLLRKVFPWCSKVGDRGQGTGYRRPCFYYHLGLCPGPCAGVISKDQYNKIISKFSKFMDGKKEELVKDLTMEMERLSKDLRFEDAGRIKGEIEGIQYITQTNRVSSYLENPNFLEMETSLALKELQKDLNIPKLPIRIECYDISNIGGKDATGSMVVLTNGDIDKSQYRRFKIRLSGRPNDVGMHKEMIKRRLKHKEWLMPDLIIVDGGRGQVRGVKLTMDSEPASPAQRGEQLKIPVFGLAKRMEWVYPPEGEIIKLPKKSLSLKLLQKIRDESHRFAIGYHRIIRRNLQFKI